MAERRLLREKTRAIYDALPELDCGVCGYGNCGQFARAVVERKASPFGCRQNPWSGYRINQIMGVKVPAYSCQLPFTSIFKPGALPQRRDLREELRELSHKADSILIRIEKLAQNSVGMP